MGVLRKLPLKEEEIMGLTPSTKLDPYQVLTKLKENQNENLINYRPLNSMVNREDHENEDQK